jgi:hypothetical protein
MTGDFLFASIRDPACRMFHNFEKVVKVYLAIPVTPAKCYQSRCDGKVVHQYGGHAFHQQSTVIYRHNSVRDLTKRELRAAQRSEGMAMDVHVEPQLKEYGVKKKANAPDASDARADIRIFLPSHGWQYWLDVTITHPKPYGKGIQADIDDAEKKKYDRYLDNYVLSKEQVIPLVFTFMGGWSQATEDFLKLIFRTMAKGDEEVFKKRFARFRYQAAMAIVKALGSLLNRQIWANYIPGAETGLGVGTEEMLTQLPPEAEDQVEEEESPEMENVKMDDSSSSSGEESDESSESGDSDESSESGGSDESSEVSEATSALLVKRSQTLRRAGRSSNVAVARTSTYNLRSQRRRHPV